MLRVNRVINQARASISTCQRLFPFPPEHFARKSSNRFLDIYKGSADEMNRGYFAGMSELKQHGDFNSGNAARKFPATDVAYSDGRKLKLPIVFNENGVDADELAVPKASLVWLSFRASSQVLFLDPLLLCLSPIKQLLLRFMRKPGDGDKDTLRRQTVYSFGDHYYFRKEFKIPNLLTRYIFLLENFGRVRWQGFGLATKDK